MIRDDLFWPKVDKSGECWEWTAGKDEHGYGRFWALGRSRGAHRIAYMLLVGDIPQGKSVDHKCHNRSCVNPEHLRLVTNKQNGEHRISARSDSKSGVLGVSWHRRDRKWYAQVMHNGKQNFVGAYPTIEEAEAAVRAKRLELYTHNDADRRVA